MLITDKNKITIPIEYPKSSMIIKNPHHKLALMFQISVDKDDNNNQLLDSVEKQQPFHVKEINVFPLRGILLPGGQQLISFDAVIQPTKKTAASQYRKSKQKSKKSHQQQMKQTFISTISISSSYLLEINKQYIAQQMIKNSSSFLPQSKIDIEQLSQIQMRKYEIYLQFNQISSVFLQQNRTRQKYSLPEKIQQNYNLLNSNNKPNKILINSLDINKKANANNQSTKPENEQFIYKNQQKQQQQIQQNKNQFQNSKLNQDYDLIRNKTTLNNLQTKRSNQLFKIFQSQSQNVIKNHKNNNKNNNNNSNTININMQQKSPVLKSQNIINYYNQTDQNDNKSEKLMRSPPILNPNQKIDESIVIESFRHQPKSSSRKRKIMSKQSQQKDKANYRSIQLLVLAIVAAIFLSLGNNLRILVFE